MIKEFFERVHYEGYTHTELEQAAGGGGKRSASPIPSAPAQATMNLGGGLSTGASPLLEEVEKKPKLITEKKKGTRGLQIPTTTHTVNTTPTVNTVAGTGIQI